MDDWVINEALMNNLGFSAARDVQLIMRQILMLSLKGFSGKSER